MTARRSERLRQAGDRGKREGGSPGADEEGRDRHVQPVQEPGGEKATLEGLDLLYFRGDKIFRKWTFVKQNDPL